MTRQTSGWGFAVESFDLADNGSIPNNPHLPALIYRSVLAEPGDPAAFERLFASHGWSGSWRNGIYAFHHYHSTAHEVLGIAAGKAMVQLGGENGTVVPIGPGDVILIPAGVGHRNVSSTPDFLVVGAYPAGQEPDLRRGEPGERPQVLANIRQVPLPGSDPVAGADGPLVRRWFSRSHSG
jgi:uncharacterized protein YjlB